MAACAAASSRALVRFAAHIFLIALLKRKLPSVQNSASRCRHTGYREAEVPGSSITRTPITTLCLCTGL